MEKLCLTILLGRRNRIDLIETFKIINAIPDYRTHVPIFVREHEI